MDRKPKIYECASCGARGTWGHAWVRTKDGADVCSADCARRIAATRCIEGFRALRVYEEEDQGRVRLISADDRETVRLVAVDKGVPEHWIFKCREGRWHLRLRGVMAR